MKKRWVLAGGAALALGALPQIVGASGDFGCSPTWALGLSRYECAGSALIGPRNDTRVNMAWLMREKAAAAGGSGASYPDDDWDSADFGHVFVSWDSMQATFWPKPRGVDTIDYDEDSYAGTLCQTLVSGAEAFRAALASSKTIEPAERAALSQARDLLEPACNGSDAEPAWPSGVTSRAGEDYLDYLKGAQAFYVENFGGAAAIFEKLAESREPWVAETSRYMQARNALAASQVPAFGEWGWYDNGKVDSDRAAAGRTALNGYLKAYPEGRYAASATGLQRRALWLMGAQPPLSRIYDGMLARQPRQDKAVPGLIEEIEAKLFFTRGMSGGLDAPLTLATWDFARMRQTEPMMSEYVPQPLSAEELEAQAPVFADMPELYGYLKASQAFHVEKDYRRVLELLPDDARRGSYTPLAFSRQLLRGLALEQLNDPNAAGFWQQLAGGAKGLYQRPAVELALAMNWERSGDIARVFAKESPITEPDIRVMLLQQIAGPDLLRRQAGAAAATRIEREAALFILLYKELSRGRYADFVKDLAKVESGAHKNGWIGGWLGDVNHEVPLGLFTSGDRGQSYPCPALSQTARTLAKRSDDPGAQLCLAEFYRLNGFDAYLSDEGKREAAQLGGTPSLFLGDARTRADLYAGVLASPSASAEQTAYALYRSVMCYAPAGNNSCNPTDVPVSQREAWFKRLKRDYPKSKWAIKLKYYW